MGWKQKCHPVDLFKVKHMKHSDALQEIIFLWQGVIQCSLVLQPSYSSYVHIRIIKIQIKVQGSLYNLKTFHFNI